ncbi:HYC_CC_PP family protein [Chitinophagaceae bacterium LWZ2-11]
MKKLFVFILSIVYLTASNGATVHLHYCMGKAIAADFAKDEKKQCDKCGMTKKAKKGCCKDEQKEVKISQDQTAQAFAASINLNVPQDIQVIHYNLSYDAYYTSGSIQHPRSHAPPLIASTPLFILNRSILI